MWVCGCALTWGSTGLVMTELAHTVLVGGADSGLAFGRDTGEVVSKQASEQAWVGG